MFKRYYSDRFREIFGSPLKPEDGLGDDALRADLERSGLSIPAALFDYYALAGRHWINDYHDRLLPVAELEWIDDKLVFLEENQCVALWGIRRADLAKADPVVWQGVNNDPIEWYAEDDRLSRFLMATWQWTMTGEEEPPESEQADA